VQNALLMVEAKHWITKNQIVNMIITVIPDVTLPGTQVLLLTVIRP
jgi:hypothetical protein